MRKALVASLFVHAAVGGALWFRAIEPPAAPPAPVMLALRPVAPPAALEAPPPPPPEVLPPAAPAEAIDAPPAPVPQPEPDWISPEAVPAPDVRRPLRFRSLARPLPRHTPPPAPAAPSESVAARAAPKPAAVAEPAPAGPVAPPRLDRARSPRPAYPLRARRLGLEGEVVIRAQVTSRGTVESAEIETSSGHAALDRAALEAVKRYRYAPAHRNGRPVAYDVRVPVLFRLD